MSGPFYKTISCSIEKTVVIRFAFLCHYLSFQLTNNVDLNTEGSLLCVQVKILSFILLYDNDLNISIIFFWICRRMSENRIGRNFLR